MREYYEIIDQDPFNVLPVTFLVKNVQDDEFRKFEIYYNNFEKQIQQQK